MLPFWEYSILPKHSPTEAMLIIGGYQQVGVPITEQRGDLGKLKETITQKRGTLMEILYIGIAGEKIFIQIALKGEPFKEAKKDKYSKGSLFFAPKRRES